MKTKKIYNLVNNSKNDKKYKNYTISKQIA